MLRVAAGPRRYTEEFISAEDGELVFLLDNSFSWLNSKSLTLSCFEVVEEKPTVMFVLGGPGAGKGTTCLRLQEKYGCVHLSAGDLLRAKRQEGGELGEEIDSYIKAGKIVPNEVTVKLIQQAMKASGSRIFLIDGYPRNNDNLEGWMRLMGDKVTLGCVLHFECPFDVLSARIVERGKMSGRSDDNVETLKNRFAVFNQQTMPVLDYFAKQGLVRKIDSSPAPDAVFAAVENVTSGLLPRPHEGYRCDKCGAVPITGVRQTKPIENYDLCTACYTKLPEADKVGYVGTMLPPIGTEAPSPSATAASAATAGGGGTTASATAASPSAGAAGTTPGTGAAAAPVAAAAGTAAAASGGAAGAAAAPKKDYAGFQAKLEVG
eukprot:SAG22_NODE_105_length_20045_cov_23.373308_11_plen_378_part_00